MAQIKLNAQTNSATDHGLSGLFKSSITRIYIILFLSSTVTCSLWGYIELVSFSHCTGTARVLHLNSLISFWYRDVTPTKVHWYCLENLVPMARQSEAALLKLASWLDALVCSILSQLQLLRPALFSGLMWFYITWAQFTPIHMRHEVSGKVHSVDQQ